MRRNTGKILLVCAVLCAAMLGGHILAARPDARQELPEEIYKLGEGNLPRELEGIIVQMEDVSAASVSIGTDSVAVRVVPEGGSLSDRSREAILCLVPSATGLEEEDVFIREYASKEELREDAIRAALNPYFRQFRSIGGGYTLDLTEDSAKIQVRSWQEPLPESAEDEIVSLIAQAGGYPEDSITYLLMYIHFQD